MMKRMGKILLALGLMIGAFAPTHALAATLRGRVTRVATLPEFIEAPGQAYQAQMRVRLTNSTCNGADVLTRTVTIRSGRTDTVYTHNGVSFRNAFELLKSAYLSNKIVVIENVPSCDAGALIYLWATTIEMQ
jgi:hypothetical protein